MGVARRMSGAPIGILNPELRTVAFGVIINIRPHQGNRGMEIENPDLRKKIESIVRHLLDVESA